MKYRSLAIILTIIISGHSFASWKNDLTKVLNSSNIYSYDTKRTINKIIKAHPGWKEVIRHIRTLKFKESEAGLIEKRIICTDGKIRPYVLYIPEIYNPKSKTPVFIYLHGGVGRSTISSDPLGDARKRELLELAKMNNWIMIFPYAEVQSMWWIKTGHKNVQQILREVKANYNVDDNRVWISGFSDGGSGAFYFSMTDPTDFAAFIPLNGHMGVGGLGGAQLYPSNMKNSPLYVINTDLDELYPAREMIKLIDLARSADANIFYKEIFGIGHDGSYIKDEIELFSNFLKLNPRNPTPHHLEWKSANEKFGKIQWLKINHVNIKDKKAPWHKEYNLMSIDNKVSIGIFTDYDFSGVGVKITGLSDGDTFAKRIGLKKGDIIIKLNDLDIINIDDLDKFKKNVRRGDVVTANVTRKNKNITLSGRLPEPITYNVFSRKKPDGAIIADIRANTFNIKTSRVKAFSIYVHPDMIQINQAVAIIVNGVEQYRKVIIPDIGFLIRNYIKNKDRSLLYVKRIDIVL